MATPTNMSQMIQEFRERARALELQVDVAAAGNFNAMIAFVGEAPGEREKASGMPFMGSAGSLLWNAANKINLKRSDVYTTNVVKRQLLMSSKPGADNEEKVIVHRSELANWEELVRWELAQLPNLRFVVLLGSMALEAFHGEKGIMKWRGTVKPYHDIIAKRDYTTIITYNPAYPIREPKQEIVFRFDMGRVEKVMLKGYVEPKQTIHINPSFTEAMQWIDKMQDEKRPVAHDIEVISNETACYGFGNTRDTAMCINLRSRDRNRFTVTEERQLLQRIQRFYDAPDTRLVTQNGGFDGYFQWVRDRLRLPPIWFDTLLAHHELYPRLPHSLGFLTSQYTDMPFYKDEKDAWKEKHGNIDDFWRYNGKDCCATYWVMERELKELQQQGLEKHFFEHTMRLQPHLVLMTTGGMLVDVPLKDKIAGELREDVERLQVELNRAIHDAVGDTSYNPNPRSAPQLRELLFSKLRLVGRGLSTDKVNRKRMADNPKTSPAARTVLSLLDKFKKEDKFLSTYAEMGIDSDGRVRCDWKQYGVASAPGRLSSSSVLWGSGTNLQNQPGRAHAMFLADPDYELWYFDLSQAEARHVAWEARIDKWKEQFERARLEPDSYDCHRALASEMFNVSYDQVPKADWDENGNMTIRYIAKRCRHGLNYRMAPDRLAEVTGMPLADATRNYNLYHRITPRLREWWAELEAEVKASRMLYNSFGRRLFIMERLDEEALESIVAFKPQSTIGEKVGQVIYQCHEDSRWPSHARVVLNVHDALIGIARKDQTKTALRIAIEHAEKPIWVRGEPLIIPAEGKISVPGEDGIHRWSTLKKVKL